LVANRGSRSPRGVDVGVLDLFRELGRVTVPDPAGEPRLYPLVDHLRQAADRQPRPG
jgi:hypothetical protein